MDTFDGSVNKSFFSVVRKDFHIHYFDIPANPYDSYIIISYCSDCPGNVSPMQIIIIWVAIIIGKVITINVIFVAIYVVVEVWVTIQLRLIDPHISSQVWVIVVNSCIKDSDYNILTSRMNVPSFRGIYIGIFSSSGLAGIVQAPQIRKNQVIREC